MDNKPSPITVIIHGAIIRPSTYQWTKQLQAHLLEKGLPDVRIFYWSGKVRSKDIARAGSELAELLRSWALLGHVSLRVFAKSTGALVFRSALQVLQEQVKDVSVDVLLQVAAPNPLHAEPTLAHVKRIVNIYSGADRFLRFFMTVGPFRGHRQLLNSTGLRHASVIENIEIPGIGHHAFNCNTLVEEGPWKGWHLYDIYCDMLMEKG